MRQPVQDEDPRFFVDEAGNFDIANLQSGAWMLCVRRNVGSHEGWTRSTFDVTSIALQDGATTHIDLDLSSILPGTLEGTITHNGKVLADTQVQVQCTFEVDGHNEPSREGQGIRTDAEGAFTCLGRPGAYRVAVRAGGESFEATLPSATSVVVVSGQTTRHAFAIWSGTAQVLLRNETGAPAAGVTLMLDDGTGRQLRYLPPTDEDGAIAVELPPGTATVMVLPKRLQSGDSRSQVWQEGIAAGITDPLAVHRITLGTATVRAGETTTIELQLPPDWSR